MRDAFLEKLQDKGIGVGVHFRPVHLFAYYMNMFGYQRGDFPVAELIGDRTISLPLYAKLKDEEICYIINSVKDIVSHTTKQRR